jgi:short subunit dehydrogenase-like uncharacterized protein
VAEWLIYGATGYSGRLIAEKAAASGLRPILAGRGEAVRELAERLGLPCRIFALEDAAVLQSALSGVSLVLNCAGPFSATAAPLIRACLAVRAHYLDITGEIEVFVMAHGLDAAAKERGILLCPGVGFDVVPTDCVAAALKEAMPDATRLALAFDSRSPLSPGTAKTMVEGLGQGGRVRRNGEIVAVPFAYDIRKIDFGRGAKTAVSIPWGDVATAYFSTGIPDIAVYTSISPRAAKRLRWVNLLRPILGLPWLQDVLKRSIGRKVTGPDQSKRAQRGTYVWGEVRNAHGERRIGRLETPNGYTLTVDAALAMTRLVLDRPAAQGGYVTPSRLGGWHLVESLPGCGKIEIGPR